MSDHEPLPDRQLQNEKPARRLAGRKRLKPLTVTGGLMVCGLAAWFLPHAQAIWPRQTASQVQQTNAGRAAMPSVIEGRVVRVSDGDSIRVLWNGSSTPVRLAGIDAPESGQPWSRNARAALAGLVAGQSVSVAVADRDRYGRLVGSVTVRREGRVVQVNRELIRLGAAWVYRAHNRDPSALALEADARAAGRGLWSLPPGERVAPWEYRRQGRSASSAAR